MLEPDNCPICGSDDIRCVDSEERILFHATRETPEETEPVWQEWKCRDCDNDWFVGSENPKEEYVPELEMV